MSGPRDRSIFPDLIVLSSLPVEGDLEKPALREDALAFATPLLVLCCFSLLDASREHLPCLEAVHMRILPEESPACRLPD